VVIDSDASRELVADDVEHGPRRVPQLAPMLRCASLASRGRHTWQAAAGVAKVAVLCGTCSVLSGAVVFFVGWAGNVMVVRTLVPGPVSMKASTAVMFVLCGTSVVLLAVGDRRRRRLGRLSAAACLVCALAFLSEYILGWNLGIDQIPFRDVAARAAHVADPGRPGLSTASCFVLISVALLAMQQRRRFEGALMVPVFAVAGLCIVGFSYSIPAFYAEGSPAKIALNTGLVFLFLGAGVVCVRPGGTIQRMASTTDPGGVMARRLVPLAVVVPLALGWLALVGQRAGVYGVPVGAWLLTTATIVCLLAVIVSGAQSLSRADRRRRGLEAELHRLVGEDELTGLPNRRRFEQELQRDLAFASDRQIPGALLMIDFDRFKAVNDEYGHAAGDALLRAMSDALTQGLRATDTRGRIGGDEFVAYLSQTDEATARQIAEGVLDLVRTAGAAFAPGMRTTASIGIATDYTATANAATMLGAADGALYRAKRHGGNRVAVSNLPTSNDSRTPRANLHREPAPPQM